MSQTHKRNTGLVRSSAILRYAFAWIAFGAIAAAFAVAILRDPDRTAKLPPIQQTSLVEAMRAADCRLHHFDAGDRAARSAGASATSRPRPGHYEEALRPAQLISAVRHGLIVYAYRPRLDPERVDQVVALQKLVPEGTIVGPDARLRSYEVVATGYRRQLRCPHLNDRAIDALRLFRGRYIGIGPESR